MSRTEFVLATAIILFVAFCLGWFANWLLHRFTRVAAGDVAQLDKMSQELHEAEETRDQAITYLQQREAELTNQLAQTEAELSAAMDGPARCAPRGRGNARLYRTSGWCQRGGILVQAVKATSAQARLRPHPLLLPSPHRPFRDLPLPEGRA